MASSYETLGARILPQARKKSQKSEKREKKALTNKFRLTKDLRTLTGEAVGCIPKRRSKLGRCKMLKELAEF